MKIGIVGAGFSGLLYAYKLSRKGYNVEVYEEHGRVGYPPHCTGLVSQDTIDLIGDPAKANMIAHYNGVTLVAGGVSCTINTTNKVVKLDRVGLEEDLMEEAASYGARIRLNARVEFVKENGRMGVGGEFKSYDLIILAEGIHGSLRRQLDVEHRFLITYGYNVEVSESCASYDNNYVIIEFDENLTGFRWKVPLPGGTLYGVLSRDPRQSKEVLSYYAKKLAHDRIYGGIVVHGPPLERLRRKRVLIVGDAAGLNKPLTGGGLYPNSLLASRVSNLDLSSEDYTIIDKEASIILGRLKKQYRIARAYYLSHERGYRVLRDLIERGFCQVLDNRIDYDGHEKLTWMLFSSLVGSPLKFAPFIFRDFYDLIILLMYYLGIKQTRI